MKFYLANLVTMKFYFPVLLLVGREERHTAEAGEEGRKPRGIIGSALSEHGRGPAEGEAALASRRDGRITAMRTIPLRTGHQGGGCAHKVSCCTLSDENSA